LVDFKGKRLNTQRGGDARFRKLKNEEQTYFPLLVKISSDTGNISRGTFSAVGHLFNFSILLSAGCKVIDPELEKARALWESKNFPSYDMELSADIPDNKVLVKRVMIKVRDGKQVSILPVSQTDMGSLAGYYDTDTVEKIFNAIQHNRSADVPKTTVAYNKEYGYPEKIIPNGGGMIEIKSFNAVEADSR
jgi:hypothetical protein